MVDVRKPESVSALFEKEERDFGRLDFAVNNAGIVSLGSIEQLTVAQWDEVMAVNLPGVFLCTQAEVALMRRNKFGRIINTSSMAGKVGFPNLAHYSATKFRVVGFTNAVAKEVRPKASPSTLCAPAWGGTGMWRGDTGISKAWALPGDTEEASWARHQGVFLPQGNAQTPEDMGQMVVYLACAPHVTGEALAVDCGCHITQAAMRALGCAGACRQRAATCRPIQPAGCRGRR